MARKLSDIGEFGLIGLLRRQFAGLRGVVKGIGDDTAVLSSGKDKYQLFTTDMIAEGVHFTGKTPSTAVGRKAIACNISDIAAMGGNPRAAVVSLGVPPRTSIPKIRGIYQGIRKICRTFGVAIVGGDTVRSNKLIINVALLGDVGKKHLVTRGGAKRGDWIFVTGRLGGSLKSGRHLKFTPRIKESQFLVKHHKPTAMIDISDGLAADLGHILAESKAGAVIYGHKIPCRAGAALKNALYDGEDFELLFTVGPGAGKKLIRNKRFSFIGEITEKRSGLQLVDRRWKKQKISAKGYRHF